VYADLEDKDGEFMDEGDIEKARILLVHNPELELEEIPDRDTVGLAYAEEDFGESPVQRRRVNEDGESVPVTSEEQEEKEERRKQREKRKEARMTVENYYNGTSRGHATAMMLMELSNSRVNKLDQASLWWAILGVTEQYVNDDIDENMYDKIIQALIDVAGIVDIKTYEGVATPPQFAYM
jgi:hypothetical protein